MKLAIAALLAVTLPLHAQHSDPPAANPARPTVTNPATLPPVGYLQFEQGYLGSLHSPETDTQYGVNAFVKLAVHPRLMFVLGSQPFAHSTFVNPSSASNDAGFISVAAQAVLLTPKLPSPDAKTPIPSVAVQYAHTVRAGSISDVDLGSNTNSFVFLFSGDFGKFHYDTNYIFNEEDGSIVPAYACPVIIPVCTPPPAHKTRRAQYGQTLSVNHPFFIKNAQLTTELYHFTQPLVTNTDNGFVSGRANLVDILIAPSYTLRPNIVIDFGFVTGITNTSTRWQSFAGVTYLLPHRLWPEHKSSEKN